jgi:hypothetical protein
VVDDVPLELTLAARAREGGKLLAESVMSDDVSRVLQTQSSVSFNYVGFETGIRNQSLRAD